MLPGLSVASDLPSSPSRTQGSADCNRNGIPDEDDTRPFQFRSGHLFPAGRAPVSFAAADFDGDGDTDVALADLLPGSVSLLLNNGYGVLKQAHSFGVIGYAQRIAAADFNADSAPDLVISTSDSVTVAYNDGHAHFTDLTQLPGDNTIVTLEVIDLDGDDDLDIVFTSFSGTVFFGLNEGMGWSPPFSIPNATGEAAAADMDSDGDIDLVLQNGAFIAANEGNGTFAAPVPAVSLPGRTAPTDVAVVDLDGDGRLDLASVFEGSRNSNTTQIALNRGDGTVELGASILLPPDTNVSQNKRLRISPGDIDQDGDADLAVVNNYSLLTAILRNDGHAGFVVDARYITGPGHDVTLEDMTGDGTRDLVVLTSPLRGLAILPNDGTGRFVSADLVQVPDKEQPYGGPEALVAADVDGDRDLDLAAVNREDDSVSLLLNPGGRAFAAPVSVPVADESKWISAADIDGDGRAELAVASEFTDTVTMLGYQGAGSLAVVETLAVDAPSRAEFARLEANGGLSLVVAGLRTFDVFTRASGKWMRGPSHATQNYPGLFIVVDLDHDGIDEIVTAYDDLRVISLSSESDLASTLPVPTVINELAPVDFDADGSIDIALAAHHQVWISLNDGTGHLQPLRNLSESVGGALAAGDLDGDHRSDLVVGSIVLRNYGLETIAEPVRFLLWLGLTRPIVADLDGDSRSDIAVAHNGSGRNSAFDPGGVSILWNDSIPAASRDCNLNRIPDACDAVGSDCNHNGTPDDCERDSDNDSIVDSCDVCPGVDDRPDRDSDEAPDCHDNCPSLANSDQSDVDGDRSGDVCDECPEDPLKTKPLKCGCGVRDMTTDTDGDTVLDCNDACPGWDDRVDENGDSIADCREVCLEYPRTSDRGDANCDGTISAGDLPALVKLLATDSHSTCGGEIVTGSCAVCAADVEGMITRLFCPACSPLGHCAD